jgi:hypothetical protein
LTVNDSGLVEWPTLRAAAAEIAAVGGRSLAAIAAGSGSRFPRG